MFWYIRTYKDSARSLLDRLAKMDIKGELDELGEEERVELARQVQGISEAAGRNLYVPSQKLWEWFINPSFIRGISGGNRSGKTTTLVLDCTMQAEGWHPMQRHNLERLAEEALDSWVRERAKELLRAKKWIKSPPVDLRYVTVDFDTYVSKVIGPEFRKWATLAEVEDWQYDNEKKRSIKWKNGTYLEFMTYKQDVEAHGGAARDKVVFDEEPQVEYFKENQMRVLTTRGKLALGMTATRGVTWTKEMIWEPGFQGKDNIYAVKLSTYDNPSVTEEMVNEIKGQCLDATDIDIRIYGEIKARGGNVFKMYRDVAPWIIEPFKIPKDKGLLICSIDPHPQVNHAIVWAWVDFEGLIHDLFQDKPNIYFIDAMFVGGHIPYIVSMMRYKEATEIGLEHEICLCDPSAWIVDQTRVNSKSIVNQFNDAGIYPIKGSKNLSGGLIKMGEMLSLEWTYADQGLITRDRPQAMIFNTDDDKETGLGRLRWELRNYRWASGSLSSKIGRQPQDKVVDRDDHLIEASRRIIEYIYDKAYEVTDSYADMFQQRFMVNGIELIMPEEKTKEEKESMWS